MSAVLENIQQEEPTEEEIAKYAEWLELDPKQDEDLMWIAREGLRAELPEGWRPCRTDEGDIYYFNFETGQSMWDHPQDQHYKDLARVEKAKKAQRLDKRRREEKKKMTEKSLGIVTSKTLGGSNPLLSKKPLGTIKPFHASDVEPSILPVNKNLVLSSIPNQDIAPTLGAGTKSSKDLKDIKAELKEANKELKRTKKSLQQLKDQESELKGSIQELKSTNNTLTKSNKELSASNEELRETNTELLGEVKFITQKRKRLTAELQELEEQSEQQESMIKERQALKNRLDQEVSDLKLIIESLSSKRQDIQTEVKQMNDQLREGQEQMRKQEQILVKKSGIDTEVGLIDASSLNLSTSFQAEEIGQQEQERNMIHRQIIDLREQLSALNLQFNEENLRKRQLEFAISTLSTQKEELSTDCKSLSETRHSLLDSLDTLKKQIQESETNFSMLQDQIAKLVNEKNVLLENISKSKLELSGTQSMKDLPQSIPSSPTMNVEQNRLSVINKEIHEKQKKLEHIKNELQKNVESHQEALEKRKEEISILDGKISHLKEKKSQYLSEIETLKSKITTLSQKHQELLSSVNSPTNLQAKPKNHTPTVTTKSEAHTDKLPFKIFEDEAQFPTSSKDFAIDDNLLSLITSSFSPVEKKRNLQSTIHAEMERLQRLQDFVDEEKKQIRQKKHALEKARNEWKEDHDDKHDIINEEVLHSVKQMLDRQRQETNQDIGQLNRIQSYITLRKKQLNLLTQEEEVSEPQERLFYKRNQSPFRNRQQQNPPGEHTILKHTINRLKDDIDHLHRVIEKENITPKSLQEVNFRNKWNNYFEEQRTRYGGRVWDFQDRIRRWNEATSTERNILNNHQLWLKNFRRELGTMNRFPSRE